MLLEITPTIGRAQKPSLGGSDAEISKRRCGPPIRLFSQLDRKSTRLNSSHLVISYAVFCLKKKNDGRAWPRKESLARIPQATLTDLSAVRSVGVVVCVLVVWTRHREPVCCRARLEARPRVITVLATYRYG